MSSHQFIRLSRRFNNQHGFTIVEFLVAAAISLVMLAVIAQVFMGARTSYMYQTAMARMQESARFATDLISQDVKSAGFQGCGTVGKTANVITDSSLSWWLDTPNPVRGYDLNTGFPADFTNVVTSSDGVVLIRTDSVSERLVTAHDPGASTITVSSGHQFEPGEILFMTDCQNSAFFQMSGPTGAPPPVLTIEHLTTNAAIAPNNCQKDLGGNCGSTTAHTFSPGSLVSRVVSNAYFIAPASGGNGNALWMRMLSRSGTVATTILQEMVPGVQAMKLLYGVNDIGDADSSADRYLRAAEVDSQNQRGQIVSIKLEFLLRSEDGNLASTPQTYVFDDTSVTAADRNLYRVMSTTLNLRNRTT